MKEKLSPIEITLITLIGLSPLITLIYLMFFGYPF